MSACWPFACYSAQTKHPKGTQKNTEKKPPHLNTASLQLTAEKQPAEIDSLYISPDTLEIRPRRQMDQIPKEERPRNQLRQQAEPQEPDLIDRPWRDQAAPIPEKAPKNPINWKKGAAIMERLRQADPAITNRQSSSSDET